MSLFRHPTDLVAALRAGDPAARDEVQRLVRDKAARVVRAWVRRTGSPQSEERLTDRALHWVPMHLLALDDARLARVTAGAADPWEVFVNYLLVSVARLLAGPARPDSPRPPPPAPPGTGNHLYAVSVFCRPHDEVGGDVWQVSPRGERLWVLLADICGHSWPAYLLACGLPDLWQTALAGEPAGPADVLARMEDLLCKCLPGDLFVEVAVGRFDAGGAAEVMVGGGPLVLRCQAGTGRVEQHSLGGPLLGLGLPGTRDCGRCLLGAGDEVLLASDGVKDRPLGVEGVRQVLQAPATPCLHDGLVAALQDALRRGPQADDITVVTVRRR